MPIRSNWVNEEKTIIVIRYGATYTPEELIINLEQVEEMLDSVGHTVNFITFMGQVPHPPSLLSKFPAFRRKLPTFTHVNSGLIIYVAPTDHMRSLINIFINTYPDFEGRFHIVDSYEEALAIIG